MYLYLVLYLTTYIWFQYWFQEKILEEQNTILGDLNADSELKYYQLQEMTYLEIVIKESLRLYPPVPFIGRTLEKDINFGEYIVINNGVNIDWEHYSHSMFLY